MTLRLNYVAAAPDGMKSLSGLHSYIAQSGLPRRIIELAYLRASQINGCAYCIDMHTRDLVATGISPEKLALVPVWRETDDLFDTRERAALAWTEIVTLIAEMDVDEEDFEAARDVFEEKELADLTLAIGMINAYNRMGIAFRAVPKAVKHAKT